MSDKRKRYWVGGLAAVLLLPGLLGLYLVERRSRSPTGVTATVRAESLYLKSGPGVLFDRLGAYRRWAPVAVLGQAAGGDWLYVEGTDGWIGWMAREHLFVSGDGASVPEVSVARGLHVQGTVSDSFQQPVAGAALSFSPEDGGPTTGFIVHTDAEGEFHAFFPEGSAGRWVVQVVGLDCRAPVMDAECELSEYYLAPAQAEVTLPGDAPLAFVYHRAATFLRGVVHDSTGRPMDGIRVVAESEAGAASTGLTAGDGQFRLPAAEGLWQVYALRAGQSSDPVRVRHEANGAEPPIVIVAP